MSRNPVTIPLPLGTWPVIVADPPWSFNDRGSRMAPDQRKKRLGRKGYRTLSTMAIASLPVQEVAQRDALLFLWTTSAHLVDGTATHVALAWGFEPKTTIAWFKGRPRWDAQHALAALLRGRTKRTEERAWKALEGPPWPVVHMGAGHYVRGAHELVLVAARGRATRLVADRGVPSAFFAPSRGRGLGHSRKPEAFRELVERLTGRRPVLELFARTGRKGWTCWGDQAPAGPGVPAELSTEVSLEAAAG